MAAENNEVVDSTVFAKQLSTNTQISVQRKETPDQERHLGGLIGNILDDFLILGNFDTVRFDIGEIIIVRMVLGNYMVGFETEITNIIDHPKLYFVKFPSKIEALNLRKAERITAFFPADVRAQKTSGGSEDLYMLKTRVLDISSGGCSFTAKQKIDPNTEINISFALPGDRQLQALKGMVVKSEHTGSIYTHRVKFSESTTNFTTVKDISQWISENSGFLQ